MLEQAEIENSAEKGKGTDMVKSSKTLIGNKRKRTPKGPKEISYEYEEEREDLTSKLKSTEKIIATKRRAVSKSTASSEKRPVDF